MNNSEFVNVRGQNLLAVSTWASGQEFLIIAIPRANFDAATASIVAQQSIDIVPGLKVTERTTGKLFEILSPPTGYSRHVQIKDIKRNLTPINVTEDELRQKYRFTSM
jgi:hypothetical protein